MWEGRLLLLRGGGTVLLIRWHWGGEGRNHKDTWGSIPEKGKVDAKTSKWESTWHFSGRAKWLEPSEWNHRRGCPSLVSDFCCEGFIFIFIVFTHTHTITFKILFKRLRANIVLVPGRVSGLWQRSITQYLLPVILSQLVSPSEPQFLYAKRLSIIQSGCSEYSAKQYK